jgi:putative RecB family exonuclease
MPPETISVSQITLYLTCSLKYRFQYIDRLPKLIQSASLAFGSAIHAALQWLHKEQKKGRTPPLDEILRVFEGDWEAQLRGGPKVTFGEHDAADTLLRKGKELLSEYYHRHANGAVREAELRFQLPLVNPATGEVLDVPLQGIIDLVGTDDTLAEFKTSLKTWSADDIPDQLQLTAYAYAFETFYGRKPAGLRLVNLVRTKQVKVEVFPAERGPQHTERLFHLAREVRKAVTAGVFAPNRGCWMCKDCEYRADCEEWTGNES